MVETIRKYLGKDPVKWERTWMMARMEFKLRYYENKLGLIWALIKPLLNVAIYFMVFQVIMNQGMENYAVFLFLGILLWQFFAEGTSGMIRVLLTKKHLYDHTIMEKSEIYISTLLSNTIGFVINLIIFFTLTLIAGVYPSWHILFFPLIFINLFLLTAGISLILSHLFLYLKDITQIWTIVMLGGFFLSPIFYAPDRFEATVPWLNYVNPMSGIIINSRNVLMYDSLPDWKMLCFDFGYALLILAIGIIVFRKYSAKASEIL